jgi:hypothetical protein
VLGYITVRSLPSAFRTAGSAGGEVTQSTLSPYGEGGPMLHEALQKLRYGLRRLWYFLTDTPLLYPDLEDKLGQMPETQAQRLRRRWERSRQRTVQR